MRWLARSVAAAAVSAGAMALVALFSAQRLASAPFRGRLQTDPLGSFISLVAFAVGIAAFVWLGRSVARDGGAARTTLIAGATGGALTGLAAGTAQSLALADYLTTVLTSYAVPSELLVIALATYVAFATAGGAFIAAVVCYAAWRRTRLAT
jgi:hypothetical protein